MAFFAMFRAMGRSLLPTAHLLFLDRLADGQAHITTCHHQYKVPCPPMPHMSINTFELQNLITKGHAGVKAKIATIGGEARGVLKKHPQT